MPPSRRLAALSLRHSLFSLLEAGCARPPRAVLNNAFMPNNYQVPVPGLREMAHAHTLCDPKQVGAWTKGIITDDRRLISQQAADAEALQRRWFNDSSRPSCLGRCEEVAIKYDARFVQQSYERAAATDAPERCTQEFNEIVGVETFTLNDGPGF